MVCVITQKLIKLLFWILKNMTAETLFLELLQRGNLDWILNMQHCVIMKHKQVAQHSCLTSSSFSWIVTIKEGVLSFLHSSAVVSVMSLLGSGALLQATVRHCLIYTHYFLPVSSGMWRRRKHLLHGISDCKHGRGTYFTQFYSYIYFKKQFLF